MDDKKVFVSDSFDNDQDRNHALAVLLDVGWLPYQIVKIERIVIGSESGWRVTYRV